MWAWIRFLLKKKRWKSINCKFFSVKFIHWVMELVLRLFETLSNVTSPMVVHLPFSLSVNEKQKKKEYFQYGCFLFKFPVFITTNTLSSNSADSSSSSNSISSASSLSSASIWFGICFVLKSSSDLALELSLELSPCIRAMASFGISMLCKWHSERNKLSTWKKCKFDHMDVKSAVNWCFNQTHIIRSDNTWFKMLSFAFVSLNFSTISMTFASSLSVYQSNGSDG